MKVFLLSAVFIAHTLLASAQVCSYCDLRAPPSPNDPNIVLVTDIQALGFSYPRGAINSALARDSAARQFLQAEAFARNQTAQQSANRNPSRNPNRAPSSRQYAVPEMYEPLCAEEQVAVYGKFVEPNEFCYVMEEVEILATVCRTDECQVSNDLPFYQRYYCTDSPNQLLQSAMVFCTREGEDPNNGNFRFETLQIPTQCVCRKYNCNLAGMNL